MNTKNTVFLVVLLAVTARACEDYCNSKTCGDNKCSDCDVCKAIEMGEAVTSPLKDYSEALANLAMTYYGLEWSCDICTPKGNTTCSVDGLFCGRIMSFLCPKSCMENDPELFMTSEYYNRDYEEDNPDFLRNLMTNGCDLNVYPSTWCYSCSSNYMSLIDCQSDSMFGVACPATCGADYPMQIGVECPADAKGALPDLSDASVEVTCEDWDLKCSNLYFDSSALAEDGYIFAGLGLCDAIAGPCEEGGYFEMAGMDPSFSEEGGISATSLVMKYDAAFMNTLRDQCPSACAYCPEVCADWCSSYTCGKKACSGCGPYICPPPPHCDAWCNAHTCGSGRCKGCDMCVAVGKQDHCQSFCNEHTCGNRAQCGGCTVCGGDKSTPVACVDKLDAEPYNGVMCTGTGFLQDGVTSDATWCGGDATGLTVNCAFVVENGLCNLPLVGPYTFATMVGHPLFEGHTDDKTSDWCQASCQVQLEDAGLESPCAFGRRKLQVQSTTARVAIAEDLERSSKPLVSMAKRINAHSETQHVNARFQPASVSSF